MRPLVLSLVLLSLAGCKDGQAPPANDLASFQPGLQVSDSLTGLELGTAPDPFVFGELREIWVRVKVTALPGVALRTLRLINPKGETQYEERQPYAIDTTMGPMMMGNMPAPVDLLQATVVPGGVHLDRSLLIAATNFYKYPYEGVWTVQASVEGVPGTFSTTIRVSQK